MAFKYFFLTLFALFRLFSFVVVFYHQEYFSNYIYFFHPISVLIFALLISSVAKDSWRPVLIMVFDFSLPIFGFVSILLFWFFYKAFKSIYENEGNNIYDIDELQEDYDHFVFRKENLINENHVEFKETSFEIEPYIDIFDSNDVSLKLGVVDKLSKKATKDSVKLLQIALLNDDYEVKYFSRNILEKFEKNYLSTLKQFNQSIELRPDDTKLYNHRAFLYMEIVNLKLFDESIRNSFIVKAYYDIFASFQLDPNQIDLLVRMVETTLRKKDYLATIQIGQDAILKINSEENINKIKFFMLEAYFYLKDYKAVKEISNDLGKFDHSYAMVADVIDCWSNRHA